MLINRIIFQITIELGIRGKNDVADDTDINLEAQVKDHPDTKQTIALKVAQDMAPLIPLIICKILYMTPCRIRKCNQTFQLLP